MRTTHATADRLPHPTSAADDLGVLTRRSTAPTFHHSVTDRLTVRAGTVLIAEGAVPSQVLVVRSGTVVATDSLGEVVRVGPGVRIGADEVMAGASSRYTWTALDPVELIVMHARDYRTAILAT